MSENEPLECIITGCDAVVAYGAQMNNRWHRVTYWPEGAGHGARVLKGVWCCDPCYQNAMARQHGFACGHGVVFNTCEHDECASDGDKAKAHLNYLTTMPTRKPPISG